LVHSVHRRSPADEWPIGAAIFSKKTQHCSTANRPVFGRAPQLLEVGEDEAERHERDPDLPAKLRAEWPGILAWAVDGCQEWLEMGLRPPERVLAATASYFEAEDSFSQWLEEACIVARGNSAPVADLYESWRRWAEQYGEHPGTTKHFSETLIARGFERARIGHAQKRGFAGLSLRLELRDFRRDQPAAASMF
jgi:phage/plasmid-associated DNA primase